MAEINKDISVLDLMAANCPNIQLLDYQKAIVERLSKQIELKGKIKVGSRVKGIIAKRGYMRRDLHFEGTVVKVITETTFYVEVKRMIFQVELSEILEVEDEA